MAELNLTPDEKAALIELLRDTIAADQFPLKPAPLQASVLEGAAAPHGGMRGER